MKIENTRAELEEGLVGDGIWRHIPISITGHSEVAHVVWQMEEDALAGRPSPHCQDVARRFVACWNACEGIGTGMLECFSPRFLATYPDRSLAERTALTKQRDELIAAMEEVLRISDRKHDAWDKVKAMIAEIKQ